MPTKIVAADGSGDFLNMEALRLHMASISVAITEPFIVQIKGAVDCASEGLAYPLGTSAANYLRFEGVAGSNPKITNENTPTKEALRLGVQHLRLLNLTLESNSTALAFAGTGSASGYTLYIENTKILQPNTTANPNYTMQANPAVVLFRNVLFVGKTRGIDFRPATTGDVKVLNCTIWLTSGDYPALLHANTKVYNSYAGNAGTSTKDWLLTGVLTNGSNNASKDTSATTITTVGGIGGIGAGAFTNTTTYDFSLASGSPLLNVGATLAENTTDINGIVRPQGAAYDIGAYERVDSGGTAPTGTVTIGTITPNSTGASVPFTYSAADQTGFEYRINGGAAVAGTNSPQVVSGLTPSTSYTIEIRAINASGQGAWSTAANFTTSAPAAQVPQGTVTIGAVTTTQTTASVPYTYSLSDQTGFEYRLNGGSAVTATASPQSLTGLTANTAYTIEIRAINATGAGTWSAVKNFTTAAAAAGTITITDVVNNTNTPWTSAAVDAATVMPLSLGSVVVNKTGLSTTAGADLVIADASIVTGTEYIIILKIGSAYGWYRAVAT